MQAQGIGPRALGDDELDRAVLDLLIHDRGAGPWAVAEVAREIGDRMAVDDALARLYGAGLIHRLGGFVFATRAAVRAAALGD